MSADTSWKIHLSALKEKRRVHSQKASSQVESSSMLKVVSPGTPIAGDDNSDIAIVDDASEDISLRDSYLQRKILDELSASTTWLAASLEADEDYQSRSRSDNIHDITPDAKQAMRPGPGTSMQEAQDKAVLFSSPPSMAEEKAESKLDQSINTGAKGIGSSRAEEKETYNLHETPPASPDHRSRGRPTLTTSPSSHASKFESTAVMKVTPVTVPTGKEAGRLIISPGRERGEFARRLELAEMSEVEERSTPSESSQQRPDEWKAAVTSDGRTYYYNRQTRISAWKVPVGGKLAPSAPLSSPPSSSSRVRCDTQRAEDAVLSDSLGLFCMFCGVAPTSLGVSLLAHLDECQRCDLASEEVVDVVMKLAAKLGTGRHTISKRENSALASRASHVSSSGTRDSAKYSESFDSFVEGEDSRGGEDGGPQLTSEIWKSEKCTYCSRTFAPGRLAYHEPSCRNAHSFGKVVPFDAQRKRVAGTQMEFSPSGLPKPATPSKMGATPSPNKPGSSQSARERLTPSSSGRPSSRR